MHYIIKKITEIQYSILIYSFQPVTFLTAEKSYKSLLNVLIALPFFRSPDNETASAQKSCSSRTARSQAPVYNEDIIRKEWT